MLLVLLPTKESVFWPRVPSPVPGLSQLVEDEVRLRAELVQALAAENIPARINRAAPCKLVHARDPSGTPVPKLSALGRLAEALQ
jgi:hypothetical protein